MTAATCPDCGAALRCVSCQARRAGATKSPARAAASRANARKANAASTRAARLRRVRYLRHVFSQYLRIGWATIAHQLAEENFKARFRGKA